MKWVRTTISEFRTIWFLETGVREMIPLYRASLHAGPQGVRVFSSASMPTTDHTPSSGQQHTQSQAIRLFDVDANLTHEHLRTDIAELLSVAATKASLRACIVPGSNEKDSLEALELAKNASLQESVGVKIFSTYGVHPYYAKGTTVPSSFIGNCERMVSSDPLVVAIGECGLDQSEGFPPVEDQSCWFRHQLDVACKTQKPLFLHERNAHEAFMKELIERKDRLPKKLLVHCFTGTESELRTYLAFGCYISISGLICRADKEGKRFKDVIRNVSPPADRLLLETDAPYMQFSGCRRLAKDNAWKAYPNIPGSIIQVAEAVAKVLNRDLHEVCEDSFRASQSFFGLVDF